MTNPPYPQQPAQQHPPLPGQYPLQPAPYPFQGSDAAPQGAGAPQAAAERGNPAGLIAVILVAAALLIQVVATIVATTILTGADVNYQLYGTITAIAAIFQGLVAAAAVVLGAIGLAARSRPKALAGIGLGGGAVVVFGLLTAQLTTFLLFAFRG